MPSQISNVAVAKTLCMMNDGTCWTQNSLESGQFQPGTYIDIFIVQKVIFIKSVQTLKHRPSEQHKHPAHPIWMNQVKFRGVVSLRKPGEDFFENFLWRWKCSDTVFNFARWSIHQWRHNTHLKIGKAAQQNRKRADIKANIRIDNTKIVSSGATERVIMVGAKSFWFQISDDDDRIKKISAIKRQTFINIECKKQFNALALAMLMDILHQQGNQIDLSMADD